MTSKMTSHPIHFLIKLNEPVSQSGGSGSALPSDPIGSLQEYCVKYSLPLPTYDLLPSTPRKEPQEFHIIVKVGAHTSTGIGTLKKAAKKLAGSDLLAKLKASSISDTYCEINEEIEKSLQIEFHQDK